MNNRSIHWWSGAFLVFLQILAGSYLVVEILTTRPRHNTNLGGALDPACLECRHCAVRQSRPVEHDGSGHRCRPRFGRGDLRDRIQPPIR